MALTLLTEIASQDANSTWTYCYLYEPLVVVASESNLSATKLYIDIEILDTEDHTVVVEELLKYAEFDINPGQTLSFDLMNIVRQHHDANVYKFSTSTELVSLALTGWHATVSKYKYHFKIYTDTSSRQSIKKLPVLGGRQFDQFDPQLVQSNPVNEFGFYGLNETEIRDKWTGNYNINVVLADPTLQNAKPTMSQSTGIGNPVCGGWLIWKSRFGGWMFWGFDIRTKTFSRTYSGQLEVGMFESTKDFGGQPFIPVDYTGINNSYSITLKSLGLSSEELLAVSGINASPAVYYSEPGSTKLELMRMTSASTPLSNLANGGDFSVSLNSISRTGQKTI